MKHPVSKKGFIQINIIVKDIELAAEKWAKLLGVEVYGIPGRTSYPVLMINYFIR